MPRIVALVLVAILVPALAAQEAPSRTELLQLQRTFQQAADAVAPSVVQVYVTWKPKTPPKQNEVYYHRPDAPVSGVVVGSDGYVLTSAWNVADSPESIRVTLPDGRSFDARRLGFDEIRDLALLKIDATGLPVAPLATDAPVRVGQFAIVVGRSPAVDPFTMTTGIVSATGRFDGSAFQLAARTNYGSAGGAVVDLRGRVIGIVSRVVDRSNRGQNSGVGFATPAPLVARYLPDYRAAKVFQAPRPPFLGIQADQSALDVSGVRISQVIVGTAAQTAGLAEGDVIVGFGDARIERFEDLVREIRKLGVGSKVKIKYVRGGAEHVVEATIGERPVGN